MTELMAREVNVVYKLTKFDIPDSKPAKPRELAICPHCKQRDYGSRDYVYVTKCLNCGMLYFIKRET